MEIELNRRTFLAVLGAGIVAASAATRTRRTSQSATQPPPGIFFFSDTAPEPTALPRSSAINYLLGS